jgi:hypothetical protein
VPADSAHADGLLRIAEQHRRLIACLPGVGFIQGVEAGAVDAPVVDAD